MALNTKSLDLERTSSQYVTRADTASLSITDDMTMEFWVKFESLPATNTRSYFVNKYAGAQKSYICALDNTSDVYKIYFHLYGTSDVGKLLSIWTPSTGVWYHLAFAYDASEGTVQPYLDGEVWGSAVTGYQNAIADSTAAFYFGYSADDTTYYDGLVDEIRMWDDLRTTEEIAANYKKHLVGTEANLQAYWKFEDNLDDTTANANTLTGSGSPTYSTDVPFTNATVAANNFAYYLDV